MLVYGLRLLVALITFGVGVAASSLVGLKSRPHCGKRAFTAYAPMQVGPLADVPPPPPPPRKSCGAMRQPATVEGGILNGKTLDKPAPEYPREAKDAGVSGTVAVKVLLEDDGSVLSAEAVSGPRVLREAAEEAAREARFAGTFLGGDPVRVSGTVTYNFVLR